jgi:TonB-linked SusC/RagA family outer membrane protein
MRSLLQIKYLLITLFLLCFSAVNGWAQHTVTGTVTDASTSETLPGVNILVKGTDRGASTDASGVFQVNATSGSDTLVVSFVGYETQEVPINGRTEIDVTLQQGTLMGEDVVVVGYGTQREEDVTSAVSRVNADEFIQSSPRDAGSLIQAKIPGLAVTTPSGDPTQGTLIQLRGTTTLESSSQPLVLIDGVPGELNTVPPEEIASIDVLKDGSAAAIYGSRGSNGVVLITTKRREGDMPTRIQYDGYVNIQTIHKAPEMLDAEGVREWQDEYQQLNDLGYDTNWLDVITRNPVSQTHNITFSGGSAETNYTGSLNYRNTQGLFLRSDNEQITGRFNLRHSMYDDRLVADLNAISRSQNYFTGADGGSFNTFAYRNALTRNPTDRPRDDEGDYVYRSGFEYENPLVLINEVNGENIERELRLNGSLMFNPIEQLSLRLMGSFNQWNETRGFAETFKHVSAVEGGTEGYASRGTGTNEDKLLEFTGTFSDTYDAHDVTLLGGYSYQEEISEDYWMQNYNFPTDAYGYNRMQSGNALPEGEASMNSYKESYKLIGFFSRLNYSFDNRYILMGSLRYEGNSKFGADHKWGLFPAVSAGWRISEESFMNDVVFTSNLKIRAGFGVTGIAPNDPYRSLPSLNYGDRIYNNGEWVQGISPARNANPDLRWERKEELNIGLDFSLFEDRFSGNIDVYRRDTKDLLWNYDVPVPPNVFGSILANVGQMRNEGIEVGLDYDIVQENDFTWNMGITGSTNRNKLVTLSNELYETTNDFFDWGATGPPVQLSTHRVRIGGPIGNFYGYKSVDIDEEGQWIVLSEDGDEIPISQATLDDRHVLGNGIPDYYLGWNHNARYKNLDLSITMRGAFGHQILNFQRMFYENPNLTPENMLKSAFDDVYGKRRLSSDLNYVSYYVENGDYWKLDDITLGYTFDVASLEFLQNARVYFSGRNLVTLTGYKGMDPEVDISGLDPGNDPRDKYPTTRTFTLGVNLTF